jgi:hypothetical protein
MKKVKIMLMSMAVIAIIGGALAFKAKYTQAFCTLTGIELPSGGYTYDTQADCVSVLNVETTDIRQFPAFTTPTFNPDECELVTCTTFNFITTDIH